MWEPVAEYRRVHVDFKVIRSPLRHLNASKYLDELCQISDALLIQVAKIAYISQLGGISRNLMYIKEK